MDASSAGVWAVVALLAAVSVVSIVVSVRLERQRRERYLAFATTNGMSYAEEGDDSLYEQFGDDAPFGVGHSRSATDVLSGGVNGMPVLGFTYVYKVTTRSGKSSTTRTFRWQIASVSLPAALPRLSIEDEGIFGGAVANALGFRDVHLESDDFNRRFRYKAAGDRYGSAVMPPRMMELMLQRQVGVTRIQGRSLYNVIEQRPVPEDFGERWDFLMLFAGMIPGWVLKDYGR